MMTLETITTLTFPCLQIVVHNSYHWGIMPPLTPLCENASSVLPRLLIRTSFLPFLSLLHQIDDPIFSLQFPSPSSLPRSKAAMAIKWKESRPLFYELRLHSGMEVSTHSQHWMQKNQSVKTSRHFYLISALYIEVLSDPESFQLASQCWTCCPFSQKPLMNVRLMISDLLRSNSRLQCGMEGWNTYPSSLIQEVDILLRGTTSWFLCT